MRDEESEAHDETDEESEAHDETKDRLTIELTIREAEALEALLKSQMSVLNRRIHEGRQKRDGKYLISRTILSKVSDAVTTHKAEEIISGNVNDAMLRLVMELWSEDGGIWRD